MSTTSQHHAPLVRTTAERAPTGAVRPRSRSRSRSHRGPQDPSVTSVMGPANHAPGVSIMGGPSQGLHANVMGGPDVGPRVSVMGSGDPGTRVDVFGDSDLRLVDSLFTAQSSAR